MQSKLLDGITILDFTHRLPGPLSTNILASMGAKVLKIEDEIFKDAFLQGLFSDFDKSFIHWYEELNSHKEIKRLNFKEEDIKGKIHKLIEKADAILMALPPKVEQKLGLTKDDLEKLDRPLAVVYPGASLKHKESMHDINAMSLCGLMSLYIENKNEDIVDPPFLPISGIAFGQQLSTDLVSAILKSRTEKKVIYAQSYIYETAENVLSPFWPKKDKAQKRTKFLHNGAYPCYSLYKTKDNHYVGIGSVEEKFFSRLRELFGIELASEDRFKTDKQSFEMVAKAFNNKTLEEILKIQNGEDLCLSPIYRL